MTDRPHPDQAPGPPRPGIDPAAVRVGLDPAVVRAGLDPAVVRAAAVRPGGLWRTVEVTAVTGSTNADLLARAAGGEPEGAVLAAEHQNAGRGRLGRAWVSPPRAALTFSVLLRPAVPRARLGWLPLLAGVAVAAAVREVAAVDAQLKWPNDVLAEAGGKLAGIPAAPGPGAGGKLAGILTESAGDAVVVGIGVNVSTGPAELPPPGPGGLPATSLAIEGAVSLDRTVLLAGILAGLERRYQAWCQVSGDTERSGLRAEYTGLCATIGRRVRVELPGGRLLDGLAAGIDADGRLLVGVPPEAGLPVSVPPEAGLPVSVPPEAGLPVAAGDIVHVR